MSLFLQPLLDTHDELVIDGFAGGGGASSGIEQALGRPVDVAMNHDAAAVSMHKVNHPQTLHLQSDIFEVNPRQATGGRKVGFAWFSPDCTYHSKARGSKPIRSGSKKRRALAWVITYWAGTVKPRVITLENVEEFADWGPLIGPPDALRPCPRRRGRTFRRWVKSLRDLGYAVEWRLLRACDFGAPTIRRRLYLIARCDGKPIVWPEPTHGDPKSEAVRSGRLRPWRTAAECIDWDIPMCSIFATKEEARAWGKAHGQASPIRPLAANTERRIARGVKRYVIDNPKPFLVNVAHSETSPSGAIRRGRGEHSLGEPAKTIAASKDLALVAPIVAGVGGRAGQSPEKPGDAPMNTVTAKADSVVVAPVLVKNNHGDKPFSSPQEPLATIVAGGTHHAVVAPHLMTMRNSESPNSAMDEPTRTIVASGAAMTVVAPCLVPRYGEREGQEPRSRSIETPMPTVVNDGNGANLVAASLTTFRSGATGAELSDPMRTVTANSSDTAHAGGAAPIGLVAASVTTYYGGQGGEDRGSEADEPLDTQGTANRFGVVAASLVQNNEGHYTGDGRAMDDPAPTVCANGSLQSLLGISLIKQRGTSSDADPAQPLGTVSAGGTHHGLAAAHIQRDFGESVGSPASDPLGTVTGSGMGKAGLVAAFLTKYYREGIGQKANEPVHTLPTLDRFGFVSVRIGPETFTITDIAMRMLQPKELYAAQGFRPGYVFDRGADGKPLTKTEQVRMCGNSVCPPVAEAITRANVPELIARPEIRKAHARELAGAAR